ncbi:MAG TPA: VOC family protein [Ignavibacteria bacterium]|jgi:catechol 2,3-dioxygenase-like lactoylglutathione lyase family enzyme
MKVSFISNNSVAIKVNDLAKAEEFYVKVMGFNILERARNMLAFDTGYFTLYVEQSKDDQSPVLSFTVNNLAEAKKYLLENGCTLVQEGNKYLWFKDPFGNTYDIIEK